MTGARAFAVVVATGAATPATGARVFATEVTVVVAGARAFAVVAATGVTAVVTGAGVLTTGAVTVAATGASVLMTGAAAGASVLGVVAVTGLAVPEADADADADAGADAAGVAVALGAGVAATGATVLAAPGTAEAGVPTAWTGAGRLLAAEAAGPPDGVAVAAGWLGALGGGADGLAAVTASGAGPTDDAGSAAPEPVPPVLAPVALAEELETAETTVGDAAVLTVEVTGVAAELTVEVTGAAAELTVEVSGNTAELTGVAAELTVEVTGPTAEPIAEVTVEPVDACVDVRGGSAAVAACAGRENISMIAKIPAAANAACTATTAMRRATGCGMSSSHSTRNWAAWLPAGGGMKPRLPGLAVRSPPYSAVADQARLEFLQMASTGSDRSPGPSAPRARLRGRAPSP
jgi:hypothetical protein